MLKVIYLITFLFSCLGIAFVFMALMARKRAVEEQAKIWRVFDEAKRALTLIQSDDPQTILIGLQILSIYDIAAVRIKAFPRLMQLKLHDNKQIASLAQHIIELSQSADIPERMLVRRAI